MKIRRQQGVSLVELLVATAVGLFLTAGILQLFISSKAAYRTEEGFARLQENARYAMQVLSRDIRMFGNMGCKSLNAAEQNDQYGTSGSGDNVKTYWGRYNVLANALRDNNGAPIFSSEDPMGYQNNGGLSTAVTSLVNPRNDITWVSGTDGLVVVGVLGEGGYLAGDMGSWSSNVQMQSNPGGIGDGDLALITDCHNIDIFENTEDNDLTLGHGLDANANVELSTKYKVNSAADINAMVYPFSFRTYFIGKKDGSTVPALYRSEKGGSTQEIVHDVEDMVLTFFGQDDDNNGSPDGYERAGAVSDWDEVTAVRLELLVRSSEEVLSESKTYTFDGASYTDRYKREVFGTNIAVRSRAEWRLNQ